MAAAARMTHAATRRCTHSCWWIVEAYTISKTTSCMPWLTATAPCSSPLTAHRPSPSELMLQRSTMTPPGYCRYSHGCVNAVLVPASCAILWVSTFPVQPCRPVPSVICIQTKTDMFLSQYQQCTTFNEDCCSLMPGICLFGWLEPGMHLSTRCTSRKPASK